MTSVRSAFSFALILVAIAPLARAANVAIEPTKLVVVDKLTTAGKAKAVFVAKDTAVSKGAATDPTDIGATFDVTYDSASGAFAMPEGSRWLVNNANVAKYVNKEAPTGGAVKVSVIKPAKLVKMVSKSLGDTPLDIFGEGAPVGSVSTAYCVTNGGEETCMCSAFTVCTYKSIAAGQGAKLVCKTGTGDAGCGALPTTTSTSTTSSTTTSTLVCPTCLAWRADPCNVDVCQAGCEASAGCVAASDVDACINATLNGFSCCSLGASTCATSASSTCSTEWATCGSN